MRLARNVGVFTNLLYYNKNTREMEFICSDEITEDGIAELTFNHASDYAIVIDKEPVDESVEVESPESESPTTEADSIQNSSDYNDVWNPWWIILIGALVIIIDLSHSLY